MSELAPKTPSRIKISDNLNSKDLFLENDLRQVQKLHLEYSENPSVLKIQKILQEIIIKGDNHNQENFKEKYNPYNPNSQLGIAIIGIHESFKESEEAKQIVLLARRIYNSAINNIS